IKKRGYYKTMDGFNIGKIFMSLRNPEILFRKLHNIEQNKVQNFAPEINSSVTGSKAQNSQIAQNIQNIEILTQQLQMNTLAGMDRSLFIRNILGLPQNLAEVLLTLQNPARPLMGGTLGMGNINGDLLRNQGALAKVFNDNPLSPEVAALNAGQNAKAQNDAMVMFFSGMINLPDISKLIIQNGKHAVASLIIAMASASKQGLSNEQIQETLGIINSCIAMAESENHAQSLKSLMMLYLPWLPLNEGVGFDLEITPKDGENDSNDSKLTVLIQTKNYGNLKGVFTLTTSNSVDIYIICNEDFPKNLLLKNLQEESTSHAMNTNIDIEEIKTSEEKTENPTQETKVNLSATNEMNPYLLLMAHSFIRNTILLDNSAS
ncbi:MAG: hypothetical protein MJ231_03530, partial [bacterium]|nr:hypothetical protein [bacterium]